MDDKSSGRAAEKKDKLEGILLLSFGFESRTDDNESTGQVCRYGHEHLAPHRTTTVLTLPKTEEMQQQAIEVALEAMEKFTIEKVQYPQMGSGGETESNAIGYRPVHQERGMRTRPQGEKNQS